MNRYILSLSLLLIVSMLTGCRNVPEKIGEQERSATPTVSPTLFARLSTPTLTPSVTASPTIWSSPTPPSSTPTPAISNTPAIPPEARLKTQCLEVLPTLPPEMELTGRLVLEYPKELAPNYLLDLKTGNRQFLPQTEHVFSMYFAVSPDGKWLAYDGAANLDATEYSLVIRPADEDQPVISFRGYPPGLQWLNNQWIALQDILVDRLNTLILLNPFTGEKQVLEPDYPDILWDDREFWGWQTITIYDPTLTRVIYLAGSSYLDMKLVLWDRQAKQPVFELLNFSYTYFQPRWSPGGQQFVFVKSPKGLPKFWDEELILVDLDGKVTQLTNLTSYYEEVRIYSFSWSPNGHQIAFWLNKELAVLDLESQKVTNYCIRTYDTVPIDPIWSPDSQHLAIGVTDQNKFSRAIVVNMAGEYAAQIAEEVVPVGWMVSAP